MFFDKTYFFFNIGNKLVNLKVYTPYFFRRVSPPEADDGHMKVSLYFKLHFQKELPGWS